MLNPIYFGCDFLEFEISNFKNLEFSKKYQFSFNLDFDNSSQGFINTDFGYLSYRKVNFKNYEKGLIFSISIDNIPFDIFYFKKGKINKSKIQTKDSIGFYSTFFVLDFLGKLDFSILDFYQKNFLLKNNKLKRLDICLDLANSIEDLNKTLFKDINFFSQIGKDKKNDMFSQTYYIKNPMSGQNRFYIFRIYDKILDSFKKGKNFLFSYLEDFEDVRRIELEIRPESCKMLFYEIEDILKNKGYCLEAIFKGYLEKNGNSNINFLNSVDFFQDLGALSSIKKERREFDLNYYFIKKHQIPKDYISKGHGYIKKIYGVGGFDVLFDLIFKSYIDSEKKIMEKSVFSYKLFENFLDYFAKNNLNKNIIERIYQEKINNIKPKKIKLGQKRK